MNIQKSIVGEELLSQYDFYIWEIMSELRAAEGLDRKKLKLVFELLDQMIRIYNGKNQIDKVVLESFITIPGNMLLISKEDKEQGKEIELASKKLFNYRKSILEKYIESEYTLANKNLIMNLRENSIGKEGFITLIEKDNIFDKQKVDNTFNVIKTIIANYDGINVVDKEVGRIFITIYEHIFTTDLQMNRDVSNNVIQQFQKYLKILVKVEE
ncbi:MAG: hypothetical protein K0S61_4083 [Anaerocolumna sp.]|jgi:hypothetical protein|nr:hypothetical protein [Anaerocolumna sp.]